MNDSILDKQVFYWTSRYALLWKQYKELVNRFDKADNDRYYNLIKAHTIQRDQFTFEE